MSVPASSTEPPEPAEPSEAARSGEPGWTGPLPEPVRARLVGWAATALSDLAEDEVPAPLKPVRNWARPRRTKAGAAPLALALDRDAAFRQRTYARARADLPDLAAALEAGEELPAADPVDVAAVAYLGRTPGWATRVADAEAALSRQEATEAAERTLAEVARLREELASAEAARRAEAETARGEVEAVRAELAAVQKELREQKGARRRAERAAAEAAEAAAAAREEAAAAVAAAQEEASRARSRQVQAEEALAAAKRAVREGRSREDARLRLLLDTVVDAASGLRRELALPPVTDRPADAVPGLHPGNAVAGAPERALAADDPALLDQLLALPQVHLIVDGYNVTKTGYPDLPLEDQRSRLVTGLAALAARSGAEVTCCFDGASLRGRVPAVSARGVRVKFSAPGEIADELIRRLVRAEPPGRPVVVVSSDREVADAVRRAGARPVSALALVRRLDRG